MFWDLKVLSLKLKMFRVMAKTTIMRASNISQMILDLEMKTWLSQISTLQYS